MGKRGQLPESWMYFYLRKLEEGMTPMEALEALHVRKQTYGMWRECEEFVRRERQTLEGWRGIKKAERMAKRIQERMEREEVEEVKTEEEGAAKKREELRRERSALARVHPGKSEEEIARMMEELRREKEKTARLAEEEGRRMHPMSGG